MTMMLPGSSLGTPLRPAPVWAEAGRAKSTHGSALVPALYWRQIGQGTDLERARNIQGYTLLSDMQGTRHVP